MCVQKQSFRGVLQGRSSAHTKRTHRRATTKSVISTMLLCNFIKVTNTHGRAPENPGRIMLHIMYTVYAYIYIYNI